VANGMWDLSGWRIMTPEEIARDEEWARQEREESLKRWPMSQRRDRCYNCGCFMPNVSYDHTRCKRCGESFNSLQ